MKRIEKLGFAVALAAAAIVLIGATSAMAETTAICTVDEEPCATANQAASIHFVAANLKLVTSLATIQCESVLLAGTVLGLGTPQVIHYTKAAGGLVYTNCKSGKTACTVEEVTTGGLIDVLKEGFELADVVFLRCWWGRRG